MIFFVFFEAVLWIRIRIHRIPLVLAFPDPNPYPLVSSKDPDLAPDPSSSKNSKKNLDFYCICNFFMTFYQCS